jgi:hypothetical protein
MSFDHRAIRSGGSGTTHCSVTFLRQFSELFGDAHRLCKMSGRGAHREVDRQPFIHY